MHCRSERKGLNIISYHVAERNQHMSLSPLNSAWMCVVDGTLLWLMQHSDNKRANRVFAELVGLRFYFHTSFNRRARKTPSACLSKVRFLLLLSVLSLSLSLACLDAPVSCAIFSFGLFPCSHAALRYCAAHTSLLSLSSIRFTLLRRFLTFCRFE